MVFRGMVFRGTVVRGTNIEPKKCVQDGGGLFKNYEAPLLAAFTKL
jgi:hypothetical protein